MTAPQTTGPGLDAPLRVYTILEEAKVLAITAETEPIEVARRMAALRELLQAANLAPAFGALVHTWAVTTLKAAKFPNATRYVDEALGTVSQAATTPTLSLADVDPWPEPVDGTALLNALEMTIATYIVVPPEGAVAIALWTVFSHTHDAFQVSPLLTITSPVKRCGKTTLLTVLGALVPRPLPTSNITTAALFRSVEKYRPTLLIDEADSFVRMNEDLRGVLNSGHLRSSAIVLRCAPDSLEPQAFKTWGPKAIALIGVLPDTLADRSIVVRMERRAPSDPPLTRLRADRLQELRPLGQQVARWASDHLDVLRDADPDVPEQLHDREADNWRGLLAIADAAGGAWPVRARQAALQLSGAAADAEQAPGTLLLADLQALFLGRGTDRLPSEDVVAELVKREDRPWPEWRHGHPLTVRQLAKLLKPFGIEPATVRLDGRTPRGYRLERCQDAFRRYLPPSDPQQPQQWPDEAISRPSAIRNAPGPVADAQPAGTLRPASPVADVADGKGGGVNRKPVCGFGHKQVWTDSSGNPVCSICHPQPACAPSGHDADPIFELQTESLSAIPDGGTEWFPMPGPTAATA